MIGGTCHRSRQHSQNYLDIMDREAKEPVEAISFVADEQLLPIDYQQVRAHFFFTWQSNIFDMLSTESFIVGCWRYQSRIGWRERWAFRRWTAHVIRVWSSPLRDVEEAERSLSQRRTNRISPISECKYFLSNINASDCGCAYGQEIWRQRKTKIQWLLTIDWQTCWNPRKRLNVYFHSPNGMFSYRHYSFLSLCITSLSIAMVDTSFHENFLQLNIISFLSHPIVHDFRKLMKAAICGRTLHRLRRMALENTWCECACLAFGVVCQWTTVCLALDLESVSFLLFVRLRKEESERKKSNCGL